jgi:CCR4-NOT transcriptional regulation complex NOT5 subunit
LYANNDSNNNKLQGDIQAAEDELRAIEEEIRKAQESAKSGPAATTADKDQSKPKSTEPKADNTVLAGTGLFLPLVTVAASRFVVAQKERREEAEEQARLEKEQELRAKQLAAAQAGAGAGPIAVVRMPPHHGLIGVSLCFHSLLVNHPLDLTPFISFGSF